MAGSRLKRTRKGDFSLGIPESERDILRALPGQLREMLAESDATTDPALRRLFPPAYPGDAERTAEFDALVRDDLVEQRMAAIQTMERTIDARRLSEEEILAWLSAVNDLRLVLGTRLDVTEEMDAPDFAPDDPRALMFALYGYLSYLEEEIVAALSGG